MLGGSHIAAPPTAVSGAPFDVTLTALDPYGNVDTNYSGTTTWASSDTDPGVVLPADYTFQSSDNGTHTFVATLANLGSVDAIVALGCLLLRPSDGAWT